MKAFLLGLVALVAITAVAALTLQRVPISSMEAYTEHSNVRL
jgi:hypothetical protein